MKVKNLKRLKRLKRLEKVMTYRKGKKSALAQSFF